MTRGEYRMRLNTAMSCVIITLLVVVAESVGSLNQLERWFYDQRAKRCQVFSPPPTDRLVHFDIDDKALEDIGGWPWPRTTMAAVLDELRMAEPKVVALDILYTEKQAVRWERGDDGRFQETDDDRNLADAIGRLGNVLVPAGLALDTAPQDTVHKAAREMQANDLELTADEVTAALRGGGVGGKDLAERVRADFVSTRREAARDRILRELDAAEAQGRPLPTKDELKKLLIRRTINTPIARTIDGEYEQAMAIRELRRFARPKPPGLPPLYQPDTALVPIARVIAAARASGFVDYPLRKDGVVREVPLFVEFDGRLYPQMGLEVASIMLDADPKDFILTSSSVTIPGNGTDRKPLVIPVHTLHPEGGGREFPTGMAIPWVGDAKWENTYPKRPHLSLAYVYGVRQTRDKIARTNAELDKALNLALLAFDEAKQKEYNDNPLPLDDALSRLKRIDETLAIVDPFVPSAAPDPEKLKANDPNELMVVAVNAIRSARGELPDLKKQLDEQAGFLRSHVKGNAVLIGWAATAQVADRKPTSIHPSAPGVVVHGQIVNAILTGELWRTLPEWESTLTTFLVGLAASAIVARLTPGKALTSLAALLAAYWILNGLVLFDYGNTILAIAAPTVAIGAVWAGGTLTRLVMESLEKARITRRFGSYVDPELVDFVLEHEDEDIFKGAEREMTVVFTDLAGFTALSEKLGKGIVPLLNEFMGEATKVIKRHHGYINKFLGDGVMFFFNAPRPRENYAAEAVTCVLDLNVMIKEFNARLAEKDLPPLKNRAGVTTGIMVVGDAGSSERSDYTVLGDLVNLAARLESANKAMGTLNLVSDRTVELAGEGFLFRPIGRLQVVGQTQGVMVYETLAGMAEATEEQKRLVDLTAAMVEASNDARPADCLEAIVRLEEAFGESNVTQLYRDKCEEYLRDPSAGAFERQIVLTSK